MPIHPRSLCPFTYPSLHLCPHPEDPGPPLTGASGVHLLGAAGASSVAEPGSADYYFLIVSMDLVLCGFLLLLKGWHGCHGDTRDIKLVVS